MNLHQRHMLWRRSRAIFDRRGERLFEDDVVIVPGYRVYSIHPPVEENHRLFCERGSVPRIRTNELIPNDFDQVDYPHGEWCYGYVVVQTVADHDWPCQWLVRFMPNSWLHKKLQSFWQLWRSVKNIMPLQRLRFWRRRFLVFRLHIDFRRNGILIHSFRINTEHHGLDSMDTFLQWL